MAAADPDLPAPSSGGRARARQLARDYDDLVPLLRLREGFAFAGARVRSTTSRSTATFSASTPDGVVHIARRLLDETDGPMLRTALQGFHGAPADTRRVMSASENS